jgi:hypothetical protein
MVRGIAQIMMITFVHNILRWSLGAKIIKQTVYEENEVPMLNEMETFGQL